MSSLWSTGGGMNSDAGSGGSGGGGDGNGNDMVYPWCNSEAGGARTCNARKSLRPPPVMEKGILPGRRQPPSAGYATETILRVLLGDLIIRNTVDRANCGACSGSSGPGTLSGDAGAASAPRELPKVSLVNTSLKRLKYHLDQFDNVVKKWITLDALTEWEWRKQFLIENDRLLDQIISQDVVNIVVNSSVNMNTSVNMHSSVAINDSVSYVKNCNKCLELEAKLLKQHNMVEKDEYNRLSKRKKFVITTLKNDLRKFKGKDIVDNAAQVSNATTIAPGIYKLDPVILAPKVKNNREAHVYYLQSILCDKALGVRLPILRRSKLSTSASGSKPSDNTKNDRISQTQSSNEKNKVEVQSRKVKSSLNKRNSDSKMSIMNMLSILLKIVHSIKCSVAKSGLSEQKTRKKEWKPTGKVFNSVGYEWKPTGRTFTLVGNVCPLTRITTTNRVSLRVPIPLEVVTPEHVVTRVYTMRPKVPKSVPNSKPKVAKSMTANRMKPDTSWGTEQSVAYLSTSGYFRHDLEIANPPIFVQNFSNLSNSGKSKLQRIIGYGDYQIGNVTILRIYYVKGLGHNLFLVGQFCDSDLEVAFRKHTCFVCNLEGIDLLSGSRGTNLYSLSIGDMMTSSPICLLLKYIKTMSWLWHRRLYHLNFGAINHLARHGLVHDLPILKFEKDHLCSTCALGKSKKQSHKPKSEDTNQEKLYLLHMDLCGPMRVASVNGKKYILVIVDDYSRFTWVKFLASNDEAPDFIIKFLKMIQIRLNATVRNILTDNRTEFVNQTMRDYYEQVGISHETSVARTPQQNGVVKRQNYTLVEVARTMLIYTKALLFLWAEAVATACYTQNRSII
ncbi:retrovirus-related pol polyprotein from transposon TNT 1-94 [Tanacetum coccineum]